MSRKAIWFKCIYFGVGKLAVMVLQKKTRFNFWKCYILNVIILHSRAFLLMQHYNKGNWTVTPYSLYHNILLQRLNLILVGCICATDLFHFLITYSNIHTHTQSSQAQKCTATQHSVSISLSHTLIDKHNLSLSLLLIHTHTHTHKNTHTHKHIHTHIYTLYISLTHKHTHSLYLSHTFTLKLSLSISLSLTPLSLP